MEAEGHELVEEGEAVRAKTLNMCVSTGETAAFDPVNEVPVNWGTAAAAAVGHELPGVDDGGGLFGMTIGTMEVDDQSVPGGVYLSEDALGALYDAGGAGGVKKVVGWDDGGGEGVGESGWRAAYPATGAQRRAMIAEREKEQHRQRQAAMELASVQRGQAQVEFAAYKGPPCGVGMALQARFCVWGLGWGGECGGGGASLCVCVFSSFSFCSRSSYYTLEHVRAFSMTACLRATVNPHADQNRRARAC